MGKLVPEHGDKQIVTFTFARGLEPAHVEEWNRQIRQLKERFGERLSAETVRESEKKPKKPKAKPKKPKAKPKAKPKPKKPSPRRRRKNK
jgi:hypothetical protein